MSLFDFRHPFFDPLWRRVVTVGFCLLWAAFEFSSGQTVWAMLFGAFGVIAGYQFFFAYEKKGGPDS